MMPRLPLLFVALLLAWASAAQATVPGEKACCACKDEATNATLFCALVEVRGESPEAEKCVAAGGGFVCKVVMIGGPPCTFAGLDCPVSPAPALAGAPLAVLAALLAVAGFVTLRWRARRE